MKFIAAQNIAIEFLRNLQIVLIWFQNDKKVDFLLVTEINTDRWYMKYMHINMTNWKLRMNVVDVYKWK